MGGRKFNNRETLQQVQSAATERGRGHVNHFPAGNATAPGTFPRLARTGRSRRGRIGGYGSPALGRAESAAPTAQLGDGRGRSREGRPATLH
jgi:hypothetical protein